MQKPRVLTAEQLREFITRGFLRLDSSLPCQYHEAVFDRAQQVVDGHGYFGNNLLPLIPGLRELIEDPVVTGALMSLLGEHYLLHPHRILETSSPGCDAEAFYRDSYWGYTRRVRNPSALVDHSHLLPPGYAGAFGPSLCNGRQPAHYPTPGAHVPRDPVFG